MSPALKHLLITLAIAAIVYLIVLQAAGSNSWGSALAFVILVGGAASYVFRKGKTPKTPTP